MATEAAIIVGASGFVGRNIVEALVGRVPMVIGVTGRPGLVPGCHRSTTLDAIGDLPPLPAETVVVNVAARRYDASRFREDQPAILATNTAIVNLVYAFCAARGIREVRQASSVGVYPADWDLQDDDRPIGLDAWPHDGEWAYAWSKRWGEICAEGWRRTHGVNTLTFRLSNPFGPYDTLDKTAAHVASACVIKALEPGGEVRLLGNPQAERDFVYSGDVAGVFAATLDERGRNEICNIAQGTTVSIAAFAAAVIRAAGVRKAITVAGTVPAGVSVRRARGERLFRLFPSLPPFRDLDEALVETVSWYRHALAHR